LGYIPLLNSSLLLALSAPSSSLSTYLNNESAINTANENSFASFVPYRNFVHAIEISHLDNWKINEYNDTAQTGQIVSFVPPVSRYHAILWISAYTIYDTDNLSEIMETSIDFYKESKDVDNITVVKKSAGEKLGVFPAYDYTVSFIKDDMHTKLKETGTKYGDLGYMIVYWAQADRFDKYLPIVEKMINSFRVIYLPGE
jgi:eukaryotic-like serine/threonine-protein kinase